MNVHSNAARERVRAAVEEARRLQKRCYEVTDAPLDVQRMNAVRFAAAMLTVIEATAALQSVNSDLRAELSRLSRSGTV